MVTMFLVSTTFCHRETMSLASAKALSAFVWSGGTGPLKEPDSWTPWGFFECHLCDHIGGGGEDISAGCPKARKDRSFFHQFCSFVPFEEAGFISLLPLPQGCRGFDLFFLLSISFWCLSSSFPGAFLLTWCLRFSCFCWSSGSRLLRCHFSIDISLPVGSPFFYKGLCIISLLPSSFGVFQGRCFGSLDSFFQLESFPIYLGKLRV